MLSRRLLPACLFHAYLHLGRRPCPQGHTANHWAASLFLASLFEKLGNRLLDQLLYGESRRFARLG